MYVKPMLLKPQHHPSGLATYLPGSRKQFLHFTCPDSGSYEGGHLLALFGSVVHISSLVMFALGVFERIRMKQMAKRRND